jgi:hypothetical protein
LTAASQPVTDPSKVFRSTMAGIVSRDDWQRLAWDAYDEVGELRYYVGWRSSSCSRVRLIASDIDPETGAPTGGTDNKQAAAVVTSIAAGQLGQSQLIRRATECLTVPGEVWLAIIQTDTGERWLAVNGEEIHKTANGTEIDLPEGGRHPVSMPADSLVRVWNPRPRRASEPDSPVRACLDSLSEIVRTTKTITNAAQSRLIGNGIVCLPQEISLPPVNFPAAQGQPNPAPLPDGRPAVQQLQELLWENANRAVEDPNSMAALIPILLTAPAEYIKEIVHLRFDNTVTDTAIKVRNDAISRLAMGLDVSPERLLGLGTQSNHWSAWQIADEDVQLHIAPVMETLCQALNDNILKVIFQREGVDPTRFMLWYDTSELTADPDRSDAAEAALAAGTITSDAYLEYRGLDVGRAPDLTTEEGITSWAWDRVSAHPELLPVLAPLLPPDVADKIAAAQPAPVAPFPTGQPPPQQQEPQTENQPIPPELAPAAARRNGVHLRLR